MGVFSNSSRQCKGLINEDDGRRRNTRTDCQPPNKRAGDDLEKNRFGVKNQKSVEIVYMYDLNEE